MKTPSYRNFRSRIHQLLAKACRVVPGRHRDPRSPEWQARWDSLDQHRRLRYDLSHLMHWHSVNGIKPDDAGPNTFAAYHEDTVEFGTKENRRAYYKAACVAWNLAVKLVPIWPQVLVEVPTFRRPKTKPWSAFDPGLEADTRRYLDARAKPSFSLLANGAQPSKPWHIALKGKRRLLKPQTIQRREFDIRFLASLAMDLGVPAERLTSLGGLASREVVDAVLGHLWVKAGERTTTYIAGLAWTLRDIAKYASADDGQIKWLTELCGELEPDRRGMTAKNQSRLDQVRPAGREKELLELPDKLARRARRGEAGSVQAARHMMYACGIALLIYCPMRASNLANLNVEKHIRRIPDGSSMRMLIEIPGIEVKNGVLTRYPVPSHVAAMIEEYLADYRPAICKIDSPWLFTTSTGKAVHRGDLSTRLSKVIWHETGLEWHLHLFRHWGATTYLREHPGEYESVRRLLHHEKIETSQSYLGNDSEAAVRRYQETILHRRARLRPSGTDEI
jgi:integrase